MSAALDDVKVAILLASLEDAEQRLADAAYMLEASGQVPAERWTEVARAVGDVERALGRFELALAGGPPVITTPIQAEGPGSGL